MKPYIGTCLVGLCAALSSPAIAQSIVNGSFEDPVLAGPAQTFAGGSSALTGWTITGTAVVLLPASVVTPVDGNQTLSLGAAGPGAISQQFTAIAGSLLRAKVSYIADPAFLPEADSLVLSVSGAALGVQSYSPGVSWQQALYDFTATGLSQNFVISSSFTGKVIIDAVSISAVPEPGAWALFGVGLALVAAARRKSSSLQHV